MSDDRLAPISSSGVQVVAHDAVTPEEPAPVNPLVTLRVLLYGRFRYAIILGLLLGIGGGLAAWFLVPTKYEIVGYVEVKPYLPKVLYQSDENGVLPSFETFVDLQASLLQSQRVLDRASQNPEWIARRPPSATAGANSISTDNLVVDHPKGSELITVTFTDRDLNMAMAAVKSILQAYLEISGETNGAEDAHRLQVLEDLRVTLANQAHGIHDQILTIANQYGTDDLSQRYQMKAEEVNRLEEQLQEIALNLSVAPANQNRSATTAPTTQPAVAAVTREDVAAVDARMRGYLAEEDQVSLKLLQLQAHFGEENEQVRAAKTELNFVENRIDALVKVYQDRANNLTSASPNPMGNHSEMSYTQLVAQQSNVRQLYEKTQTEALELGRKNLQLRSLTQDADAVKKRLDEASNRIQQLNVEANTSERISVLSYGEKPTTALKSKRTPLTAAAGVAGMGAGIGLVALWGLVSRQVRSVLQMHHLQPTVRMLGVLPILSEKLADQEGNSVAAHCVHQIRTLLDSGDHHEGRVIAITSPMAGDGKTSLTLALGLSFAAAGSRTLLVDCDIVGGGLTGRLNAVAHRGFEQILMRDGLLNDVQLKETQALADSTNRKLSEVIVEMKLVSDSDVQRALTESDASSVGLLNALSGDPVSMCISPILAKDLSILPLGEAVVQHSSQMSPKALRRVLSQARSQFDVVIVDTGPILGSLEASTVVREVDEVIVAVARNGRAPLVKQAITLLDSMKVRLAGLVFNRATPSDVSVAYYGSSASTASIRSGGVARSRARRSRDAANQESTSLGSLAVAVINSSIGSSEREEEDDRISN